MKSIKKSNKFQYLLNIKTTLSFQKLTIKNLLQFITYQKALNTDNIIFTKLKTNKFANNQPLEFTISQLQPKLNDDSAYWKLYQAYAQIFKQITNGHNTLMNENDARLQKIVNEVLKTLKTDEMFQTKQNEELPKQ